MEPLKEPLSYEDQVECLINQHGLIINDKEDAIRILKKVNYYRLSAYGIGLMDPANPEIYVSDIDISYIFRLYSFDSELRNIVIHVIEQLEIQLRSQISNYLSLIYGAECYLDVSFFDNKITKDGIDIHESLMENFKKECDRQQKIPFVEHHNLKYGGHFPFWVAVELFSFGNLSSLYGIMKRNDQNEIAKFYQTDFKHLQTWILSLVEIRNICAHYGRLYNMPLKQAPLLYKENRKYKQAINKLFPVILIIKRMLQSDDRWLKFYGLLENLIDEYKDVVNLSFIGFPVDWKDVLKK